MHLTSERLTSVRSIVAVTEETVCGLCAVCSVVHVVYPVSQSPEDRFIVLGNVALLLFLLASV